MSLQGGLGHEGRPQGHSSGPSPPPPVPAGPVPAAGRPLPHHGQHADERAELPFPCHLYHPRLPDAGLRPARAGEERGGPGREWRREQQVLGAPSQPPPPAAGDGDSARASRGRGTPEGVRDTHGQVSLCGPGWLRAAEADRSYRRAGQGGHLHQLRPGRRRARGGARAQGLCRPSQCLSSAGVCLHSWPWAT